MIDLDKAEFLHRLDVRFAAFSALLEMHEKYIISLCESNKVFKGATKAVERHHRELHKFINETDAKIFDFFEKAKLEADKQETSPADVVEVRSDYNVGDFCLYGFADGNKSLAIVEIVKILDDERGVAEVKFHKVIKDNTGNGFFHYLFKSGGTMNASFKYLKNITPKTDGERSENAD